MGFYSSKWSLLVEFALSVLLMPVAYFITTASGWFAQISGWTLVALLASIAFVALPIQFLVSQKPAVVIDEVGIDDTRLGIGVMLWEDIAKVAKGRIAETKADFLAIHLRDPDKYTS
ncbi:MAG: hypothetical protein FJ303_14945 [Planctomycetes bacterium]|nr:hypothetical protein [Planctomycetota bacterium]